MVEKIVNGTFQDDKKQRLPNSHTINVSVLYYMKGVPEARWQAPNQSNSSICLANVTHLKDFRIISHETKA